jgi:hypothetical protein
MSDDFIFANRHNARHHSAVADLLPPGHVNLIVAVLSSDIIDIRQFNAFMTQTNRSIFCAVVLSMTMGAARSYETGFCLQHISIGANVYCKGNYMKTLSGPRRSTTGK